MRLSTSWPSRRGSLRSSRISFGISGIFPFEVASVPNRNSMASTPSRATWIVLARLAILKACSVSLMSLGLSSTSRMSVRSLGMSGSPHCEIERGAAIDSSFDPDSPAVAGDDALHDRQADAGAFKILRAMQPLEHPEQLVDVLHVEADAVVADEEDLLAAAVLRADLHRGFAARPRVFEGVVDQVHKHLLEQRGVAPNRRQVADRDLYRAPFGLPVQLRQHLFHDDGGLHFFLA